MFWILLAEKGVSVVAFDYSEKMIELAKKRQARYADKIEFCVADATDRESMAALKRSRPFTKAVSNEVKKSSIPLRSGRI